MKEKKNPGGRPSTKDKPAILLYRVLNGTDGTKWQHLKCDTRLHENKAAAKKLLLETIEKRGFEHPVEYEIFLLMDNKILEPVTTVKFIEKPVPEETKDDLATEEDTEKIEEPNDDIEEQKLEQNENNFSPPDDNTSIDPPEDPPIG